MFSLVVLTSRFEATQGIFWDRPPNFLHEINDQDNTRPAPFQARRLTIDELGVHQALHTVDFRGETLLRSHLSPHDQRGTSKICSKAFISCNFKIYNY
ncbi:hypothetical protein AVEN_128619-1 [Araneus ventricosus]|uniref:Uncharacterized protein n=1 Tax=Araneus ventricosus TaxID=182803 RepID=A0A4Y2BLF2_ARAVE|nr:hypothetical protein AVEN_217482-1 [Araneus ventricosus]GBO31332.1 hypothetical protein AVEN_128619-1 [Araneus ventricosus]